MATLNSSNISNGNTIEPSDLLQLYSALNYEGAATKYNVSLSGSLDGVAVRATDADSADSAVESRLVGGDVSVRGAAEQNALFFPIAGVAVVSNDTASSTAFDALAGLEAGTDVFITATYLGSTTSDAPIFVDSISVSGEISFICPRAGDGNEIMFTALVLGSA